MNHLEIYKQQINLIFSCLEQLKNWPDQDNINFINNLTEYRKEAINFATVIQEIETNPLSEGEQK